MKRGELNGDDAKEKKEKGTLRVEVSSEDVDSTIQYSFNIGDKSYFYSPSVSDDAIMEDGPTDNKAAPTNCSYNSPKASRTETFEDDEEARDDPPRLHHTRSASSTNTRQPHYTLIEI